MYPTNRDYVHSLKHLNPNTLYIIHYSINIIQDLKASKSPGSHSSPQKIVKQIKKTISLPLSEIINKSFTQRISPSVFKISKIVATFKSKSRFLCNNYRPISLLSNVSTMVEKLMHKRLNEFVQQETYFYSLQLVSICIVPQTMSIIDNIQTYSDDSKYVAKAFVDFKMLLIQLTMIYLLKSLTIMMLEKLQKTGSYLT